MLQYSMLNPDVETRLKEMSQTIMKSEQLHTKLTIHVQKLEQFNAQIVKPRQPVSAATKAEKKCGQR